MKKLLLASILSVCMGVGSNAQGIVYENYFNGYGNYQHFPQDGWVEEGVENALWQFSGHQNNLAGGEDSELLLAGSSSSPFNGMSRAVSPFIDISGYSQAAFHFLYGGKKWMSVFEIGVATRSGGGDWNVVWSLLNETPIPGETGSYEVNIFVDNEDIGQADFQVCFYFDGPSSTADCKYLCFDDLVISEVTEHDIYTLEISHDEQALDGEDLVVEGTYHNNGTSTETFDAILNIYDYNGNLVYNDTKNVSGLESTSDETVTFDPYTVNTNDELFTIEVSHNLSNDSNPENDEISGIFNSYSTERQNVLLEIGTATWCQYCPGVSLAADDFIANGDDVAVIEYHADDDFDTGDLSIRFSTDFYNSYSLPTSVFDGKEKYFGGNATESVYEELFPIYEQRKAINSPLFLTLSKVQTGGQSYDISVNIDRFAPMLAHDYNVFLVLTESHLPYNWGPDLEEVNFVERFMWPSVYGQPIDLQNNTNLTEEFNISFGDTITMANSELVAFVQDMTTLEIMQASKLDLITGIEDKVEKNLISVYPNPSSNGIFTVSINNPGFYQTKNCRIIVNDVTGNTLKQIDGVKSPTINLKGIKSGIYFIQIVFDDIVYGVKKIVIQ